MYVEVTENATATIGENVIVVYFKGMIAEMEDARAKQMIKDKLARRASQFSCKRQIVAYQEVEDGDE